MRIGYCPGYIGGAPARACTTIGLVRQCQPGGSLGCTGCPGAVRADARRRAAAPAWQAIAVARKL